MLVDPTAFLSMLVTSASYIYARLLRKCTWTRLIFFCWSNLHSKIRNLFDSFFLFSDALSKSSQKQTTNCRGSVRRTT